MVGNDDEAGVIIDCHRGLELRVDEHLLARDQVLHLVEGWLVTCERRLFQHDSELGRQGVV